jgi:hypothetical protein
LVWAVCALFLAALIWNSQNYMTVGVRAEGLKLRYRVELWLLGGWVRKSFSQKLYHWPRKGDENRFLSRFFKRMRKTAKLRRVRGELLLGLRGDAAATAELCGLLLSLLSGVWALWLGGGKGFQSKIEIRPDFQRDVLEIEGSCMISAKSGHIMAAAFSCLIESWKGALQQWLTRLRASWAPPWRT